MANDDLLEIFDAPQIAILANCSEIEARHAERLRPDLRIPAIEAAEIEVGRAVREATGFDRIQIIDQDTSLSDAYRVVVSLETSTRGL